MEPEPGLTVEPSPPRGPFRTRLARLIAVTAVVVVAHNVVLAGTDLDWAYVVTGVGLAGVSLAAGVLGRGRTEPSSWASLSRWLPLGRVGPALWFVGGSVAVAVLLWAVDPLADDRLADADGLDVLGRAAQTLFGVAVVEEVLFRQGLLVGWSRLAPRPPRGLGPAGLGLLVSSLAFGLWHVAAEQARLDDGGSFEWAVVGGVLVTGLLAGPLLAVVRLRAEGLAAPVLVHASFNVAVTVGVWL